MSTGPFQSDDTHEDAPRRLVDELKSLDGPPVAVPHEIDQRILFIARGRLARGRRIGQWLRWGGAAVAAGAVAAALIIAVWPQIRPSPTVMPPLVTLDPRDINHDGRVDILDALALSRLIKDTPPGKRPMAWDINRDGVVDEADARAIAEAVVSLRGGGR